MNTYRRRFFYSLPSLAAFATALVLGAAGSESMVYALLCGAALLLVGQAAARRAEKSTKDALSTE